MVVDKRTVLNENRERVHVRWTAKRGNEIDLIGQLNVAWLLGHFRGSASTHHSLLSHKLMYNGGFSNVKLLLLVRTSIYVAQILCGFCHKV